VIMSELSKADQFLLDGIERGDASSWQQFVDRYHGRLLAFARARTRDAADAEDAVQETLLAMVKSLGAFQRRSSIETYLFTILRRKIVDLLRSRGRPVGVETCSLQASSVGMDEGRRPARDHVVAAEAPASWHAQRSEDAERAQELLRRAFSSQISQLKREFRFQDIQIYDLIFWAQLRNKEIASELGLDEKYVALRKHRFLKRLNAAVCSEATGGAANGVTDTMLTSYWEACRPTCPKRSTIGKFLLQTLDDGWQDYVQFHTGPLGCHFCCANLADLQQQTADVGRSSAGQRLFQSTVGFFAASG